jgi:hypothetical protein
VTDRAHDQFSALPGSRRGTPERADRGLPALRYAFDGPQARRERWTLTVAHPERRGDGQPLVRFSRTGGRRADLLAGRLRALQGPGGHVASELSFGCGDAPTGTCRAVHEWLEAHQAHHHRRRRRG